MEPKTRLKHLLGKIQDGNDLKIDKKALEVAIAANGSEKSSLSIKILSVVGGILASLAFMASLTFFGIYDSEISMLVLGVIFITSSLALNRLYDNLITDTFSISIYLIGIALVIAAFLSWDIDENVVTISVLIVAICSLFIVRNFMLLFISIMAIAVCLMILIISNDHYALIHLFIAFYAFSLLMCFRTEALFFTSGNKTSSVYGPLRIGLIFSFLIGLIALGKRGLIPVEENWIWLSSLSILIANVYLVYDILKLMAVVRTNSKVLIYLLTLLVLLPTLFAPSICGAILIILLSFKVNYKTGLGIGIIALIYFVSQYYYDLTFTLLTKSIILMSSGLVLLCCYFLLLKTSKNE